MTRSLRAEIQQSKPFPTLEEEVHVQVLLTAQVASRVMTAALKPTRLSPSQFNVLRILRGARPDALPASRIAERMVSLDPDLTRLLDRLEANGFVEKSRDAKDRRIVNVRITKAGLERIESASKAVTQAVTAALAPVGARKLEQLANLLDLARASAREQFQDHSR
jgi:DNA-binding MarR family transcriptional regulator